MTRIWRMNADKTLKASDYLFDPCHPCSFCFSTHLVFWNADPECTGLIYTDIKMKIRYCFGNLPLRA